MFINWCQFIALALEEERGPWFDTVARALDGSIVVAYYSGVPSKLLEAGALPEIQTQLCLLPPGTYLVQATPRFWTAISPPAVWGCLEELSLQEPMSPLLRSRSQRRVVTSAPQGPQEHPQQLQSLLPTSKSLGTPISALTLTDPWGLGSLPV